MDGFQDYAFVSLGANLPSHFGSPADTLRRAIERLRPLSDEPLLVSSLYSSSPVDCPPGSPDYHNAMVGLLPRPDETPLSLLHKLQAIEQDFGRVRTGLRNEARVLDLDLIAFRNDTSDTRELMLPHPRAAERLFVLVPLAEIAPRVVLTGQGEAVERLIAGVEEQGIRKL